MSGQTMYKTTTGEIVHTTKANKQLTIQPDCAIIEGNFSSKDYYVNAGVAEPKLTFNPSGVPTGPVSVGSTVTLTGLPVGCTVSLPSGDSVIVESDGVFEIELLDAGDYMLYMRMLNYKPYRVNINAS